MATNRSTRATSQHNSYSELPGMRASNFANMSDFIGVNFVVMDVKVKASPFTQGETVTDVTIQPVGETAITTFTASKYAANQFANLDAADYIGRNMTVIEAPELSNTSRSTKTPLVVDYWEHYWQRANGNRAQQNRDMVARGKSKAQVIDDSDFDESDDSDFDESDDSDFDESDDSVETITESDFHKLPKAVKKAMAIEIAKGNVKVVSDQPQKARSEKAQREVAQATNKLLESRKSQKAQPTKAAREQPSQVGKVILTKNSEPRKQGRPPTVVTEMLNAGRNVYYNSGVWYDDNKKVIYRPKN